MGNKCLTLLKCLKSDYQVVSQDDSEEIYDTLRLHNHRILELEDILKSVKSGLRKLNDKNEDLTEKISDNNSNTNIHISTLENELNDHTVIIQQLNGSIKKIIKNTSTVQRNFDKLGDVFNSVDATIYDERSD